MWIRFGLAISGLLAALVVFPTNLTRAAGGFAIQLAQTETAVQIVIVMGSVKGGAVRRVRQGDSVVLRVKSDTPLEVHLHGYDVEATAGPGHDAELRFVARATGRFPLNRHGTGDHHDDTLAWIEVYPR